MRAGPGFRFLLLLLFALAVLVAAPLGGRHSLAYRALRHVGLIPTVRATAPLPGETLELGQMRLEPLGEAPEQLEPQKGRRMLVDVFATWCPPCREELAALAIAAPRLESEGVDVTGIDRAEGADQVESVMRSFGITYPVYVYDGSDPSWVSATRIIPTTVLIDAHGVVLFVHSGPMSVSDLMALGRMRD